MSHLQNYIRKRSFDWVEHPGLFYGLLILNILVLFFTRFYPTADGPAHLHNANLLLQLIKGDEILKEFYQINSLPLANWTSHIVLTVFNSFLPAWIAEKIFVILYVSGMALSFRYLIKAANPLNLSLSLLIFPFIHSFLFHSGFYNFSISLIILFLILGILFKAYLNNRNFNFGLMLILLTLAALTNMLVFGFAGLTALCLLLNRIIRKGNIKRSFKEGLKAEWRPLAMMFLASIPGLISLWIFFSSTGFKQDPSGLYLHELIKYLNDARPFIVFNYIKEEIITEQYFHGILVMFVISLFNRKHRTEETVDRIKFSNILLIPLFFALILYFTIPNSTGAGMMSDRFLLIFYMLLLIWIAIRVNITKGIKIILMIFTILHVIMLWEHHLKIIPSLNKDAVAINECAVYIKPYSVVLPIDLTDHWLKPHFSNYLSVDKPFIILENYEAGLCWFPVKWNFEKMPILLLSGNKRLNNLLWPQGYNLQQFHEIDVVLLYGNTAKIDAENWDDLRNILIRDFKLIHSDSGLRTRVYERK